MRMNITVLEDDPAHREQITAFLQEYANENHHLIHVDSYASGEEFFKRRKAGQEICAYFLDIKMNTMSGLAVAKRLRREGYDGPIVFLTAFREYVFDGYDVHAFAYLLKPVRREKLFHCLDEIAARMREDTYCLQTRQETVRIPYSKIMAFSVNHHDVDILTMDDVYSTHTTLEKLAAQLPKEFIRVHRSYIVHLPHVAKISTQTITLTNGMTVPVGRTYQAAVTSQLISYTNRLD